MIDFNTAPRQRLHESPNIVDFPRDHREIKERIGDVARLLFGIPNADLSTRDQLRFGSNGSVAVEIGGSKIGTYFNHEAKRGGGVRELLEVEGGIKRGDDQHRWLHDNLGIEPPVRKDRKKIVKTWDYHDENRAVVFQVVKFEPKSFAQRRPDPSTDSGWSWKVKGVRKLLYNYPELVETPRTVARYVLEGEKDADTATEKLGLLATTAAGGAGRWLDTYSETLKGCPVVLIGDNDATGREHVAMVAARLHGYATEIKVVELPGLPEKGDLTDWVEAGGTREQLDALVEAAPVYVKPETPQATDDRPEPMPGTEDHMAESFTKEFLAEYRFTPGMGWLRWDQYRYAPDETAQAVDDARAVARKFSKDYQDEKLATARSVNGMLTLARADRRQARAVSAWDRNPWLLNCRGGTVDLRTGELYPHDRNDNITKLAGATPNPDAECPVFDKFLDHVTAGDEEKKWFLLRTAGMSLAGVVRDHVVIIHHGKGRNGKTTYLRTLEHVMGDYAKNCMPETFIASQFEHHSTDLYHLRGARLSIVSEIEQGKEFDLVKLKRFVGGDTMVARKMRGDPIEFVPEATLQIACNHLPGVRQLDDAIRERLCVVPWTVFMPEDAQDKELVEKLRREADAILWRLVEGCLEWQRIGLARPESVVNATKAYIVNEDKLQQWIDERCVFDGAYSQRMLDVYGDYLDWCREMKLSALPRRDWQIQFLEKTGMQGVYQRRETAGNRAAFLYGVAICLSD